MIILCEENSDNSTLSNEEKKKNLIRKITSNMEKMDTEQLLDLYSYTEKVNFEKEMLQ